MVGVMREPQEIEDEEHEQILRRVAAVDVAKASGMVCTRVPHDARPAKLTERGMLRPSFVPPAEIRRLRDYTRLRTGLTRERTRYWQRLEKLLEDSLIKVSSVASRLTTVSAGP